MGCALAICVFGTERTARADEATEEANASVRLAQLHDRFVPWATQLARFRPAGFVAIVGIGGVSMGAGAALGALPDSSDSNLVPRALGWMLFSCGVTFVALVPAAILLGPRGPVEEAALHGFSQNPELSATERLKLAESALREAAAKERRIRIAAGWSFLAIGGAFTVAAIATGVATTAYGYPEPTKDGLAASFGLLGGVFLLTGGLSLTSAPVWAGSGEARWLEWERNGTLHDQSTTKSLGSVQQTSAAVWLTPGGLSGRF